MKSKKKGIFETWIGKLDKKMEKKSRKKKGCCCETGNEGKQCCSR